MIKCLTLTRGFARSEHDALDARAWGRLCACVTLYVSIHAPFLMCFFAIVMETERREKWKIGVQNGNSVMKLVSCPILRLVWIFMFKDKITVL